MNLESANAEILRPPHVETPDLKPSTSQAVGEEDGTRDSQ